MELSEKEAQVWRWTSIPVDIEIDARLTIQNLHMNLLSLPPFLTIYQTCCSSCDSMHKVVAIAHRPKKY